MKVLLIGDSCTDVYVYGDVKRINPEAPVPILEPKREERTEGMAWNVYNNLNALGIYVDMITQDEDITKTRYIHETSNQQILRLDEESEVIPLDDEVPDGEYDALVISDYNKGFITQTKLFELCNNFDGPIFIDTKKKKLPTQYNNIIYKINKKEFELLDHDYIPRGENIIVTHGANGALWNHKTFPVPITRVFDVTGAGDTFLAALVFYYIQLPSLDESINFANRCAAIAVQNPGTYTLTMEDVDGIIKP